MPIVGVDIGTQSLKAVVTSDALEVIGTGSRSYTAEYPQPGWAEQSPNLWTEALRPAIADALAAAGVAQDAVTALGVSGQLDGCLAVGPRGNPLTSCLIWMDRRAADELPELDPAEFSRVTGLVPDASHMAAKIRWLKRHAALPADARFHQPVSYLVERLTGEFIFDPGLASTTMLYSLDDAGWSPELMSAFEIRDSELPQVAPAAAVAGLLHPGGAALSGLPIGIPVSVGTGDDYATPLGAGLVKPGTVACVIGTAEVVGAVHPQPERDRRGLVETHGYPGGLYFIENPGWLSGGAMTWLRDLLKFENFEELVLAAESAPPGSDGVLFLPALSGSMAPEWIASARGCFYGLTPAHGRGHMARALLEGCAYAMRDVIERLDELGVATNDILLLGGGGRSNTWPRIRASVARRTVRVARQVDTCPVGAAMLAGVAGGVFRDLSDCSVLVAGEEQVYSPDETAATLYDEAHARYRRLFESLRPMYND